MINKHPSIELCREVKELGIEFGDTNLWWNRHPASECYVSDTNNHKICHHWESFPCPTSDDVIEILPHRIKDYYIEIWKRQPYYAVIYTAHMSQAAMFESQGDTLVNALLRMAIHLKKKGLLPINTPNGEKGKEL